ncbi:MAG: type II 3-dehydroquinate dehydratase [Candidatus Latescibacteria bacterium]|nr:type II 3-dehydroquinate dehydratase [Candidatus Latescibacterota bacterium]NIM64397.1 type II 3-dehydroquinate dehydratase [Candidatus Latescibacterota bacterium]NIO00551.1 type II 3-dehydroquinate dehydratase [Candidatus Latescibacterota bacterium]NIO26951.1 type II 3-dehydroquinate dehydratase [Candidatus Latescibacterota bacterium]NIO56028.1 type II 3-dehydroquinate dehydratase [Candidatus Latescibacterota bacterium]
MKILVIHGPNLNLLGKREPDIYGSDSLEQINGLIQEHASVKDISIDFYQSNHEGDIIDRIHRAASEGPERCDALVINPGAFTHYSIAIRDAIQGTGLPAIEVHLSNLDAREPFRQTSVIAPVCRGRITGLGYRGYLLAIDALGEIAG